MAPHRATLVILVALIAMLVGSSGRAAARSCVVEVALDDMVNAGTAAHLVDALGHAEERGCIALVVGIDTPGGSIDATRDIVGAFLSAPLPVVSHVAPAGARAGSAGMFVALAAHVAAMAPGTNIGAAHPVMLGAGETDDESAEQMARKLENDAAALARAIAGQRGRNVEWVEAAVRESESITAEEALDAGVIDLIATSREDLLDELDGRAIEIDGETVALDTRSIDVIPHEMSLAQRLLTVLGNPNVAYVLLLVGMMGVMMEIYSPGLVVPGTVGGLALILAIVGLGILPVAWGGIVLMIIAAALLVAELWVASYGVLAIAGVLLLLLGSVLLFDPTDADFFADRRVRASWGVVLPLVALIGAGAVALASRVARTRNRPPTTGREALVGAVGRAEGPLGPAGGTVRLSGETWRAVSDQTIAPDTPVRVVDGRGLTLRVEAMGKEASS